MSSSEPIFLGIDPGKTGGMAWVQGKRVLKWVPMPYHEGELLVRTLKFLMYSAGWDVIVIEHQAIRSNEKNIKTANDLVMDYGKILAIQVLESGDLDYVFTPTPMTWQRALGTKEQLTKKGGARLKLFQSLLEPPDPAEKLVATRHDGLITAALIALYGQRMYKP